MNFTIRSLFSPIVLVGTQLRNRQEDFGLNLTWQKIQCVRFWSDFSINLSVKICIFWASLTASSRLIMSIWYMGNVLFKSTSIYLQNVTKMNFTSAKWLPDKNLPCAEILNLKKRNEKRAVLRTYDSIRLLIS